MMKKQLIFAGWIVLGSLAACAAPQPQPSTDYNAIKQNSQAAQQDLNQNSVNPPK
jgi:hypothetical protein